MNWWQAFILGIVEGITEYLPVSSTGHLLLTQRMLGITADEAANAFAICIQAGAIVAVLGLYAPRVKQMLAGVAGKDVTGRRLALNLIIAFLPAAVLGLAFDDLIESYLFGLWPIVTAWFIGGLLIFLVERMRRSSTALRAQSFTLELLTWRGALAIGFAQCIAMWPGTSRSLMTILAGLLWGLSMPAAVEFSFLLGVITLGAATAYKALSSGAVMLEAFGIVPIAVGFLAAWVSAVVAVRWMVNYLNRRGMAIFAYWRIGLAISVGLTLLFAPGFFL